MQKTNSNKMNTNNYRTRLKTKKKLRAEKIPDMFQNAAFENE